MSYDLLDWSQVFAGVATTIVLGFVIYELVLTRRQSKHAEKLMEYEHAPYLAPYIMWNDKIKKEYRVLHIKNIGHGAATNIEFDVNAKVNGADPISFKRNRATFLDKSHNTGIALKKDMEISLKASYYDITNRKYDVDDEYYYSLDDKNREIFRQTKRSREVSEE